MVCMCVCVCLGACVRGQWRVQSIGRGQNRDRCENKLFDKNPHHNPLMSVLPSLCDSGHFTLRECVHVPKGVLLSVRSVTQRLWKVQGTSGLSVYWADKGRDNEAAGQQPTCAVISLCVYIYICIHAGMCLRAFTYACGHVRARMFV